MNARSLSSHGAPWLLGLAFLLASGLNSPLPAAAAESRLWTVPGRPSVSAVLARKENDHLILRTSDGKEHTVPLSRLSKADQEYVASLKTNPAADGATPRPPDPRPPVSAENNTGDGALAGLRPGTALNPLQTATLKSALDRSLAEKDWKFYRAVVDSGARALLGSLRPALGADGYLNLFAEPTHHALLTHERFLNRVPVAGRDALIGAGDNEEFVRWLFANPLIMERFLNALAPEDDVVKAFEIWQQCWAEIAETHDQFARVAIACALVFDRKHTVAGGGQGQKEAIDAVPRCRDFVTAAVAGDLQTDLDALPVHELIWVVCANVSAEDLAWARKEMRLSQKNWGRAYAMVEYLMDRATENLNPYETYALEEILEVGGVCRDQAHFSANSARAVGIPAYVVSGDGDRGPHAWLGYKMGRGEWDSTTGRYQGYRTGTTRSPQTGKPVREQVFALFNERDFSDAEHFGSGHRLVWISEIYGAMGDQDAEVALAAFAAEKAPRNPVTAERWIAALAAHPNATEDQWKTVIASMRRSFRKHPDMLARAAELESEHISIEENLDEMMAAIASERRAIQRKDGERSDLVVILYRREANLLAHQDDLDGVVELYRRAFRDLSGDIPAFKGMAKDLFQLVSKDNGYAREALDTIERYFRSEIDSGSSEYFRQQSEASVRKLIDQLKAKADA